MVLFGHKGLRHGQQPVLIQATGLASGALMVMVGLAAPAQANTPVDTAFEVISQYDTPQSDTPQSEALLSELEQDPLLDQAQREQARIEKLQRLQAGIVPERRIVSQQSFQPVSSQLVSSQPSSTSSTPDGVYLYGQQPVPNQLATAYFVFESQAGSVTGAFYMPSSSFDCVQGRIGPDQMALNVTDSYSQETADYALDLDAPNTQVASAQVASSDGAIALPPNISGFHQLPVSDRDRALLATCQARS